MPCAGTWGSVSGLRLDLQRSSASFNRCSREACPVWLPSPRKRGRGEQNGPTRGAYLLLTETSAQVTAGSRLFRADGGKQVPQLVVDLLGRRHRLSDLGPDQLPVAPPQAMGGHLERLRAHAQLPGEFRVGPGRVLDQERPF